MRNDLFSDKLLKFIFISFVIFNSVYLLIYFNNSGKVVPDWDEANHLMRSFVYFESLPFHFYNVFIKGSYYPPFFQVSASILYFLFGTSIEISRSINLFFYLILVYSSFKIGAFLFDRKVGYLTSILVSTYPAVILVLRQFRPDFALLAMFALCFYLILRSNFFKDTKYSLYAGICLGLGFLTKWTFGIFVVGPIAYSVYLIIRDIRRGKSIKSKYTYPLFIRLVKYAIMLVLASVVLLIFIFPLRQNLINLLDIIYNLSEHINPFEFHINKINVLLNAFGLLLIGLNLVILLLWLLRNNVSFIKSLKKMDIRFLNVCLFVAVGAIIMVLWYIPNLDVFVPSLLYYSGESNVNNYIVPRFSLENILYYVKEMPSIDVLGFPLFLIFVIGFFSLFAKKTRYKNLLLISFIISYLFFTFFSVLNVYRFFVPALLFVAIISSYWIFTISNKSIKYSLILVIIVICLLNVFTHAKIGRDKHDNVYERNMDIINIIGVNSDWSPDVSVGVLFNIESCNGDVLNYYAYKSSPRIHFFIIEREDNLEPFLQGRISYDFILYNGNLSIYDDVVMRKKRISKLYSFFQENLSNNYDLIGMVGSSGNFTIGVFKKK